MSQKSCSPNSESKPPTFFFFLYSYILNKSKKMSRVILFLALVLASVVAEDKFAEANAAKLRTVAAKGADLASKNTKAPDLFAAKNAEKLAAAAAKDASKNTKVEKPLTEADFKQKNAEKLAAAKTKTADAFAAKNAEKRAR